jgi:hypothetical protein
LEQATRATHNTLSPQKFVKASHFIKIALFLIADDRQIVPIFLQLLLKSNAALVILNGFINDF